MKAKLLKLSWCFLATIGAGLVIAQDTRPNQGHSASQKAAIDRGNEYILQAERSRADGRLTAAETQCRAAIQLLQQNGFSANGETAFLGRILYERGLRSEGLRILSESYSRPGLNIERDLYLGKVGVEMNQLRPVQKIVDYYRRNGRMVGAVAVSTRPDWPIGNTPRELQATIELIAGSRLMDNVPTPKEGLDLLRHANKLCPGNPAINFALGMKLIKVNRKEAAACLKIATSSKAEVARKIASQWYARLTS